MEAGKAGRFRLKEKTHSPGSPGEEKGVNKKAWDEKGKGGGRRISRRRTGVLKRKKK